MRIKTLVLIPVVAVLTASVVSLPTTQNQTSANAPQNVASIHSINRSIEIAKLATYEKETKKEKTRGNEKASRSKGANSLAAKTNQAFAKSYIVKVGGGTLLTIQLQVPMEFHKPCLEVRWQVQGQIGKQIQKHKSNGV